ncbi:hypothetical protein TNCV_988151 [Trichonephila clavipes]|nr:hypothetical protein TNCV_988151 [Trichonephila clavipes]
MSSNTRCSGLLDTEGIQRLWPARSPDLNIENVWDALGEASCWSKIVRQTRTLIRALTEEWDKLPQQLLDNGKVWYDVWNVASHSTVDISRTDTFFKVPADF